MSGSGTRRTEARAFTLIEAVLVIGIILAISALVVPNFLRQFKQDELPRSGRQLRSLITLTRAHAAFDGKRYRIRFPGEDDLESLDGSEQPLLEREDDPIEDPDIFNRISAPWVVGDIFLGEVRCAEVRLGRPTIQRLQDLRNRTGDDIAKALKKEDKLDQLDPERPPLIIEPDGTSEWATFMLTTAPPYLALDELDDQPRVDVILDGTTGLAWLQRPFYRPFRRGPVLAQPHPHGAGFFEEREGRLRHSDELIQRSLALQGIGDQGVVGAQVLLVDGPRALQERLGFGELALVPEGCLPGTAKKRPSRGNSSYRT